MQIVIELGQPLERHVHEHDRATDRKELADGHGVALHLLQAITEDGKHADAGDDLDKGGRTGIVFENLAQRSVVFEIFSPKTRCGLGFGAKTLDHLDPGEGLFEGPRQIAHDTLPFAGVILDPLADNADRPTGKGQNDESNGGHLPIGIESNADQGNQSHNIAHRPDQNLSKGALQRLHVIEVF